MQNVVILLFCFISSLTLTFIESNNNSFIIDNLPKENKTEESCFLLNNETNEYWRLVWEDQFDGNELDLGKWKVEHELGDCHGNNNAKQVSCNVASNIELTSGFLTMSVKHEKYFEHNYTGAAIISKQKFRKGRYEIRASLPIGKQIHLCLFTVDEQEMYWHQNGEIDIVCINNKEGQLERGIYFANSSDVNNYGYGYVDLEGENLNEFHLFGVEWNEKELKLFFDQLYSETIEMNGELSNRFINLSGLNQTETYGARPFHQLRFQNVVGRDDYKDLNLLRNFTSLEWQCPVLVIDYVRVYEKVENNQTQIEQTMKQCSNNDDMTSIMNNYTKLLLQELCEKALEVKSISIWSQSWAQSWKEIAIISLAITILVLICLFIYIMNRKTPNQLDSITKQFDAEIHQNEQNYYSAQHYYDENIYDTPQDDTGNELDEYVYMDHRYLQLESAC